MKFIAILPSVLPDPFDSFQFISIDLIALTTNQNPSVLWAPIEWSQIYCRSNESYFPFQILYSRIAIVLWRSFAGLERHCAVRHSPLMSITTTVNGNSLVTNSITQKTGKKPRHMPSYQVKFILIGSTRNSIYLLPVFSFSSIFPSWQLIVFDSDDFLRNNNIVFRLKTKTIRRQRIY